MPPGETWGFSMADFEFRNEGGALSFSAAKAPMVPCYPAEAGVYSAKSRPTASPRGIARITASAQRLGGAQVNRQTHDCLSTMNRSSVLRWS